MESGLKFMKNVHALNYRKLCSPFLSLPFFRTILAVLLFDPQCTPAASVSACHWCQLRFTLGGYSELIVINWSQGAECVNTKRRHNRNQLFINWLINFKSFQRFFSGEFCRIHQTFHHTTRRWATQKINVNLIRKVDFVLITPKVIFVARSSFRLQTLETA